MTNDTQELWVARVNRAMDRVLAKPEAPLDLHEVAKSVHASPFHFHRVFRALVGETLHAFQKRVRLERALYRMAHNPGRRLTDIALDSGFADSASFSKAFRSQYGVAPSAFDLSRWQSERRQELKLERLEPGANPDGFQVRITELPARTFAYLRVFDPFGSSRVIDAANELVEWARDRELADGRWYGWMWEDPDLVPLSQCRYDIAVEVPPDAAAHSPVGKLELPAMTVAQIPVSGDIHLEQRALDWIYGSWLPNSEWEPGRHPCFEAWAGLPFGDGYEHFELSIQLPVVARSSTRRPAP